MLIAHRDLPSLLTYQKQGKNNHLSSLTNRF